MADVARLIYYDGLLRVESEYMWEGKGMIFTGANDTSSIPVAIRIGLSYKFEGLKRINFNYTYAKAHAPYNSSAQAILKNVGYIARIQLTWVYK